MKVILQVSSKIGMLLLALGSLAGAQNYFPMGYQVPESSLEKNFFVYSPVNELFLPAKAKKTSLRSLIYNPSKQYFTLVNRLQQFIKMEQNANLLSCNFNECSSNFEAVNGFSERQLAEEIVKSSYCFGTDPFLIASKVRQESRFDARAISPTGAIGLTQLTRMGLEELLDQLGHRGEEYAMLPAKGYFESVISCYLDQDNRSVFADFPEILTYENEKKKLVYVENSIAELKTWFSYKTDSDRPEKQMRTRRQLILGQSLLKVYLAYSDRVFTHKNNLFHYNNALKMFNGDKKKVQYAKEVIKKSTYVRPN